MTSAIPGAGANYPQFAGSLPATPKPFYLDKGEGEKSVVFDQLFTVLLSGDETDGQYGVFTCEAPKGDMIPPHLHTWAHEIFYIADGSVTVWMNDQKGFEGKRTLKTGDFGFVPLNTVHAFRMEAATKVLGVNTGGFERFFHDIGTPAPADAVGAPTVPYITPFPQLLAAGEKYGTVFMPDFPFD
jgi:quercetin 2,3-dioxygenase